MWYFWRESSWTTSRVFCSAQFKEMFKQLNTRSFFRAAYRFGRNEIVEHHHCTIKAMAERMQISPIEAVFWYNMSPSSGEDGETVPQKAVFRYKWRHLNVKPRPFGEEDQSALVQIGEEVWVKPFDALCTTQWRRGRVTAENSHNMLVTGMLHHVLDIRKAVNSSNNEEQN